jgi:hypothetical protein
MKSITIELPDAFEITSAKDAPEQFRTVKTENWTADICLAALEFGLSESMGNTWSVSKKDHDAMKARWEAVERGEWTRRGTKGAVSEAKIAERISKMDVSKLAGMLSPGQLRELLDMTVQPKP